MRHRFTAMLRTWFMMICCLPLGMGLILLPEPAVAVDLAADTITRDIEGVVIAEGNVVVQREGETLAADQINYDAKKKVFKANGNVTITSKDSTIKAESGEIHTINKTGELRNAEAILKGGERLKSVHLTRDESSIITVEDATFTSCPPDQETWLIRATHAELDQNEGVLTAEHARFELAGIPILYTPYWQQALKRKSGLLMPFISTSKIRGTETVLPYYFAPAANWDVTLTPHWMTARGFKGDIELRHVSVSGHEEIQVESINDKLTNRHRGRVQGDIQQALPYGVGFSATGDYISDRNYLADFASDSDTVSRSYLQSSATLSQGFEFGDWSLLARHQNNLLLPSNAATLQILPRFESSLRIPVANDAVIIGLNQQTTQFARKTGVDGWRVDLNPYIEVPWQLSGGGIESTLRIGGRHTRYWLKDRVDQKIMSRNTFEASLDNRINIERISDSRQWRHTITPILRYDYIEAPNQSALPNFDSGFSQLSMTNLLTGNRFTGHDRIERISRISMMLETGLQHKGKAANTARDVLMAKVGAAYETKRESVDPVLLAAATRPFSNLLGEVTITPLQWISATGSGQYNPVGKYWSQSYIALNLSGERGHHASINWQRTDARYAAASELISATGTAQLAQRWSISGNWKYDRLLKISQQISGGIHYLHPCWDLSVEGYRNNLNGSGATSDFGFRFLLGFKGLGSVGS